ncbi:MAG: hypothetical protein R3290_09495 [Acidimicrobiia bacterium]|nr:hypothetical protein [Acidimicrobiia bacterium]
MSFPSSPRIQALRRELRRYRQRYAIPPGQVKTDGIEAAVGRRSTRMAYLTEQIAQLQAEHDRLRLEIDGLETGLEAALADELDRIRSRFREAWSPTPVLGFRIWFAEPEGLRGARTVWEIPELTAVCAAQPKDDVEVPHSDGRCGRLGCGIYATKRAAPVVREHIPPEGSGWVGGLVELRGKVVEHEHGYRGAAARVVAVAAVGPEDVVTTAEHAEIVRIFAAPTGVIGEAKVRGARDDGAMEEAIMYLEDEFDRRTAWTSASSSA